MTQQDQIKEAVNAIVFIAQDAANIRILPTDPKGQTMIVTPKSGVPFVVRVGDCFVSRDRRLAFDEFVPYNAIDQIIDAAIKRISLRIEKENQKEVQ